MHIVMAEKYGKVEMIRAGISGLSLTSSVETVGKYVTVCPHTSITFTCSASQVSSLTWFALPYLDEDDTVVIYASQDPHSRVIENFNVSLVSVNNRMSYTADLISTLSVETERIDNGTKVACITLSHTESIKILKEGWYIFLLRKLCLLVFEQNIFAHIPSC